MTESLVRGRKSRSLRWLRSAVILVVCGFIAGGPIFPSVVMAQDEPAPAETEQPAPAPTRPPVNQNQAQPTTGGKPVVQTAVFSERKVEEVLTSISNQTGVSITAYGKVPGQRVSMFEKNIELEDALNKLAQPNGWVWFKQEDGSYGVADEAWYKATILPTKVVTKIFRPDHVSASELEKAIRPMLTQGISSATADPRTNKLIVVDLPEVIAQIERLIREIDVQLFTRVFYIRNGDVNEIAQKIETYKSEPGTIEVDEKTHQIIVEDLLANIKKMELLIDILDVGPEIVIYDVNNIGLEGADLEDLQKIIDTIRTPDLLFEVNEKQGVFILEDVPEVHDRVEQILATFDQPVKQVLIQGEILTTTFSRSLSYGLREAAYSPDGTLNLGSTTVGGGSGANSTGFREITFPNDYLSLQGNIITGAVLNDHAYFQWQASFGDSETKVLLQPRLLVKNQETSRIFVGSEEPFLTTFFNDNTGNNGGVTRSTSQQVVTDGLDFEITPSISNSYLIEMEIAIDNDDAQRFTPELGDQELVRRERQSVETVLTIPSGQTRVIGGLITTDSRKGSNGLPFLSKIPYVGALFGQQTRGESRGNLQLFITPTIVEDVIPRPTTESGRRGRLVTGYEKVPGAFDLNSGAAMSEEGEAFDQDLLFDPSQGSSEDALESLLREDMPRLADDEDRDTSFVRRPTGGSATTGEAATPVAPVPVTTPVPPPTAPPANAGNTPPANTGNRENNNPPAPRPGSTDRETRY